MCVLEWLCFLKGLLLSCTHTCTRAQSQSPVVSGPGQTVVASMSDTNRLVLPPSGVEQKFALGQCKLKGTCRRLGEAVPNCVKMSAQLFSQPLNLVHLVVMCSPTALHAEAALSRDSIQQLCYSQED